MQTMMCVWRMRRKRKPKKRGSAWRKPKSERSVPHKKMEDAMKRAKLAQEQLKKRRQRPKSSKIRTKRRKKSPAGTKNGCLRAMVFEFYFSMSFSTFCGAVGEEAGCTGICAEAAAGAETGA